MKVIFVVYTFVISDVELVDIPDRNPNNFLRTDSRAVEAPQFFSLIP